MRLGHPIGLSREEASQKVDLVGNHQYSIILFEDIVKAEREVNAREGSKDIMWQTEIMDVMIEEVLLDEHISWIDINHVFDG